MFCGLLGRHLSHSYSPQIHGMLGSYPYAIFEREPEELEEFLKSGTFTGINVTIPYKKAVIPFLQELSPAAKKIGAVNTIVRRQDGSLYGHNTDYFGFSSMVSRSGLQVAGKKVLVLGSGGASATVVAVLEELGAKTIVISRFGEENYGNIERHSDAAVIVNATPVGMYPDTVASPVGLSMFPKLEGVLDLIYNPARTMLLQDAKNRGLVTQNGLWMLVAQAKEAAEVFTGQPIDDSVMEKIYRTLSAQMENLILVGMPGCGKTTVAALLSATIGKQFADSDLEIEFLAKKSIPEIFAEDGEEVFREWETKALASLGKQSGYVIATGGGCITQARNLPLLRQNGTIFWLKRDLDLLPTDGRPLSQANSLADLYRIRSPLYQQFADFQVDNNSKNPNDAVNAILSLLEDRK